MDSRWKKHIMADFHERKKLLTTDPESGTEKDDTKDGTWKDVLSLSVLVIFLLVATLFFGYTTIRYYSDRSAKDSLIQACEDPELIQISASVLGMMDQSVDPCTDFYQYSCGRYLKEAVAPAGEPKWNAFARVAQKNQEGLKRILERPGSTYRGMNNSAIAKTKAYYKACMDTASIEKAGATPMLELIRNLGSWTLTSDDISGEWNKDDFVLEDALSKANHISSTPLLSILVSADDKKSDTNIIEVTQSGLGLPAPEYYTDENKESIKQAYTTFLADVAILLGADEEVAVRRSKEIVTFETKLAEIFTDEKIINDHIKSYKKMTIQDLGRLMPSINIKLYMDNLFGVGKVGGQEPAIVSSPDFIEKLSVLVNGTDSSLLADYIVWHTIHKKVMYLSQPFVQVYSTYVEAVDGLSELPPKWQTCVTETETALGFAAGALFVDEKFPPKSKAIVEDMIARLKAQFAVNLATVHWMDRKTKERALEKLDAIVDKIGYPEFIKNPGQLEVYYEELVVSLDSPFRNNVEKGKWSANNVFKKLHTPVDKSSWHLVPSEVNAYYSPNTNEIGFPAGILQDPFFSLKFPMYMNFGGIGSVIGHELTHGFDNNGRNYDGNGNMVNWWENSSSIAFDERAQCFIDQYSQYKVGDNNLDGKNTLGENIADNGGMKISYQAYKKWVEENPGELTLPGLGLNKDQLYFLSNAQLWCSILTPEYAAQSVLTDEHSNPRYRVIGMDTNFAPFSEAFNCRIGDPMNPKKKCAIW